jgi:integrase
MKRIELTSEWLANWKPKRKDEEVSDRGCKGLVVRGQPSGVRTFYRWTDARDDATGIVRRKRIKLGHWPVLSLGDARKMVNDAKEARGQAVPGARDATVGDLAEAYRRDILGRREPASLTWSWGIIRTHVLTAKPDPKRPPFGEWPAREVRPPDVAAIVRAAKAERVVEVTDAKNRKVKRNAGGAAAARAVLREVKAIFANAVGAGSLEMSPAAVLQAKALGLRGTKRGRYLDADELKALFAALDLAALLDGTAKDQKLSETTRLGIALLLYVPVRTHSLVAAEWSEVDLDAGRWIIPVSKLKLHRDDRAEARPFTVPLPGTAVTILRKLQELAGASPWVLASPKNPKKHVGSKVLIRALARLQESGRLAFGSRLTIHDARRTWRAWAGELGVAFEVAEKSLAHVLPGVADTYAKAEMVDQRAQAAELVAAALDRIRLGKAAKVTPIAAARGA